jgi:hypothetical protein
VRREVRKEGRKEGREWVVGQIESVQNVMILNLK